MSDSVFPSVEVPGKNVEEVEEAVIEGTQIGEEPQPDAYKPYKVFTNFVYSYHSKYIAAVKIMKFNFISVNNLFLVPYRPNIWISQICPASNR